MCTYLCDHIKYKKKQVSALKTDKTGRVTLINFRVEFQFSTSDGLKKKQQNNETHNDNRC